LTDALVIPSICFNCLQSCGENAFPLAIESAMLINNAVIGNLCVEDH